MKYWLILHAVSQSEAVSPVVFVSPRFSLLDWILSLFHRQSQIRQRNDCFEIFKGVRDAASSFYNATLAAISSNKAILTASCFLWWILQRSHYLTDHALLFHHVPLHACFPPSIGSCWYYWYFCTCMELGVQAAFISSPSIKFDRFGELQWPVNAWPWRRRQLYNVAIPLLAQKVIVQAECRA